MISPCAAHCLNLILKDILESDNVKILVTLVSTAEIIRPGATRFGTTFIALKSLYDHKADLQAMVISNDCKKMLKVRNAVECKDIVFNENFWKNCLIMVKVMTPLLRLLRLCDSYEKRALGYVYEGMYRARRCVKELFKKKKELYTPYTDIIDRSWDRMLRQNIHCAAYWLNPENVCSKREVFQGVLDMVEMNFFGTSILDLTLSLGKFRDSEDTFGRYNAIASHTSTCPDEWWKLFGGDTQILQKFAIRILNQTTSSSGCTRKWSVFERIHTKKRNRLEHQRLIDLEFVHYNLRLKNRLKVDKRSYDSIGYECIDTTDFWPEGELDYNDLKNMHDEEEHEPTYQTQVDIFYDKYYYSKPTVLLDEIDSEFHLSSDREIDAYNTPILIKKIFGRR
uniref:HAT C-terminal dimerisation domain-containing protein n=1 Tax=Lactuca sativa TaxID=4236 RepID=A0A9R1VAJ3_LACSA|nr:hypothetical protein LSAT_V11C500233310 [Lactuca sativa]